MDCIITGDIAVATTSSPNLSSQSLTSTSEPPLSNHSLPLTDHSVIPTTPVVEHMHFHDDVDFSILETGENNSENGVLVSGGRRPYE